MDLCRPRGDVEGLSELAFAADQPAIGGSPKADVFAADRLAPEKYEVASGGAGWRRRLCDGRRTAEQEGCQQQMCDRAG